MKLIRLVYFVIFSSILAITPSVSAAKPVGDMAITVPIGIDVSYPQCGKQLPTTQAFGVVGINGGLANTTNSCLKTQLVWAGKSVGGTVQEKLQLYVNTANPGGLNTASWPKTSTPENTYGNCDGSDSFACAWQYGWNRASEDITIRFVPAATQVGTAALPSAYIWWLDVETINTWKPANSTFNTQSNAAVLEGMTAHFQSVNARVGLYSTAYQWSQIVGTINSVSSNLNGLINWRPGGANLSTAKQACTATPLTSNGIVVLTQYVSRSLDYDYSCI